ncbi:MAG: TetR/AcrR family transcriptional regulator [Acidimicrobiia bacterium]|nr:TetR/AcrR family transcriptional regulator [Acidimicrobiia bacterium]
MAAPANDDTRDGPADGKGAQTRQAILSAAIARFGRDGYKTTKVADIARDADVGNSLVYAYFPNKEALFEAALDEDAAGVIQAGVALEGEGAIVGGLGTALMTNLVGATESHPLARRVLAGLEPHATDRMMDIPALTELRKTVAEQLHAGQLDGRVRTDHRPDVDGQRQQATLALSLLMSMLQFGIDESFPYAEDVMGVFEAAVERPPEG